MILINSKKVMRVKLRADRSSKMLLSAFYICLSSVMLVMSSFAQNSSQPLFEYSAINHPVMGESGMVASHNVLSSEIAAEIMANGGNAIDAGAALGFALAVTLPRAGNIGGGGFMLVHVADLNKTIAIDFRETAPAAATQEMFFDADGNVVVDETYRFSHKSVSYTHLTLPTTPYV